MSEQDPLYNNIREAFEVQTPKAPEGLWDDLAGAMSEEGEVMDSRIQTAFESTSGQAPEAVWVGVRQQLNIHQAWTGIRLYLKRRIFWLYTRDFGIAMLTLLLLWWSWPGSLEFEDAGFTHEFDVVEHGVPDFAQEVQSESLNQEEQVSSDQQMSVEDNRDSPSSGNNEAVIPAEPDVVIEMAQKFDANEGSLVVAQTNVSSVVDEHDDADVTLELDDQIDGVASSVNALVNGFATRMKFVSGTTSVLAVEATKPAFESRNAVVIDSLERLAPLFQVGLIADVSQTRLLDAEYRNGRDQFSLITNRWSIGSGYGVYVSSAVSHRAELELQVHWKSSLVDAKDVYIGGEFTHKEVSLNYVKASAMYNRYFKWNSFNPKGPRIRLSAGVYWGQLRDKSRMHNSKLVSISDNFTTSDFGWKVMAGQSHTYKSWSFTYGVQLEHGMGNIFAGSESFPRDINVTTTRRAGLFLTLGRNF